MGLREIIARWLAPEAFRTVERYHYQRACQSEAYRWLGEFPDVCATIEWLRVSEQNHFRKLGEDAFAAVPGKPWIWQISDFREHLRAIAKATSPSDTGKV